MFVYEGRLDWHSSARNETAVIILPSGPMRAGEPVYILSQWSIDSKGNKKAPLSQKITIDKVIKTVNGDDSFSVKPGYYQWDMTSHDSYDKLRFVLSTGPGTTQSTMEFKRIWKPAGKQSKETGRIWVGKINWHGLATNEFCLFIAPEGFDSGKPFLSMWQWTKNRQGEEKSPVFRAGGQNIGSLQNNAADFVCQVDSNYLLTCAWRKKTDDLNVFMKGPEGEENLGAFKLFAASNPEDDDITQCKDTIAKLEKENRQLSDDLTVEKAKTADLTKRLAEAQARLDMEESNEAQKDVKIREQATRIDSLTITIDNLQTEVNEMKQKVPKPQQLIFKFKAYIRSLVVRGEHNVLIDFTTSSGVTAHAYKIDPPDKYHQIWEFYTVRGYTDVVVIKNTSDKYVLWSAG
ncbi:hypothetical protein ACHAPJ_012081 [Fusarium lateritium]